MDGKMEISAVVETPSKHIDQGTRSSTFLVSRSIQTTQAVSRRSRLQGLQTPSHSRMISFLFLAVLCTSCLAAPMMNYSYSPSVGGGSGTSFSTAGGNGRITAIRVWEHNNAYIAGIQVRNGGIWTKVIGRTVNTVQVMELYDGETIVQVSGKYHSNYIYKIVFVTSRGRSLTAGQPVYLSFNFYPIHPDAELKLLSGRTNGNGITSVGAHWGVFMGNSTSDD